MKNIVFYDGDCGLCQRSVRFLFEHDRKQVLKFAPINGVTFLSLYKNKIDELDTVMFFDGEQTYKRSLAFIKILQTMGGIYRLGLIFKCIPAFFRDAIYKQIVKRRKQFSCILIPPDLRFLP